MANLTSDFITLVRLDFKEALPKKERFEIQIMEAQPKESQNLKNVVLPMKLRCVCPGCKN